MKLVSVDNGTVTLALQFDDCRLFSQGFQVGSQGIMESAHDSFGSLPEREQMMRTFEGLAVAFEGLALAGWCHLNMTPSDVVKVSLEQFRAEGTQD